MTLKKKLSKLLKEEGRGTKKKLAEYLGVSPVYITRYASEDYDNVNLPIKYFSDIAKFFNVSPSYFLDDYTKEEKQSINTIQLPVIEALAGCGSAGMLEQLRYSEDKMTLDKRIFPADFISEKLSMIRIVGDSMMPYLDENDWAMIQMNNGYKVVPVNGVYLITHGENVQIKRCAFQPDGSCMLISDNQLYPIESAYAGDWDIVGKVVARLKVGSPMLIKE